MSVDPSQVFEKFTKESTSLLDELSIINESDKSSSVDKDKYAHARTQLQYTFCRQMKSRAVCVCVLCRSADCILLPSFDPETVLQTGKHLLLIGPVSETHLVTLPAATEGAQRGSSVYKNNSTRYCCSPVFSSDKLLQNANRV